MAGTSSQLSLLKVGDGADPEVFYEVGCVTAFDGGGADFDVQINKCLNSNSATKTAGIVVPGTYNVSLNLNTADTDGQMRMMALNRTRTQANCRFELSDSASTIISFPALIKGWTIHGSVDSTLTASAVIDVTDLETWS